MPYSGERRLARERRSPGSAGRQGIPCHEVRPEDLEGRAATFSLLYPRLPLMELSDA